MRRHTKRVLVGILGGLIVLIGVVAVPYPGPGWLIIFAGFTLLATEFAWADGVLKRLRAVYQSWVDWLKRQHWGVRVLSLALTGVIVIATIWLLNGYGLIDNWFDFGLGWVHSPLFN